MVPLNYFYNVDEEQFTGFIILRLQDRFKLVDDSIQTLRQVAHTQPELQQVLEFFNRFEINLNTQSIRYIQSLSPTEINELESAKSVDGSFISSLNTYWKVYTASQVHPIEVAEEVKDSNMGEVVDFVYPELISTDPSNGQSANFNRYQHYLKAAPVGIDAEWVWENRNVFGAGVQVADVEQGWNYYHEDLKAKVKSSSLKFGKNRWANKEHGAAVLGILLGTDNSVGIVGAAPSGQASGLDEIILSSYHDPHNKGWNREGEIARAWNKEDAISGAWKLLRPGDILVIEAQTNYRPVEVMDPGIFTLIQQIVNGGIIVIEAAGNAGVSLDGDFSGESGAILVAASSASQPYGRLPTSNYGNRIDCFAWGEEVYTAGRDPQSPLVHGWNNQAYSYFGRTSAATAIVAGAAALVQSAYKARYPNSYVTPAQMRDWLSDPNINNTESASGQNIGMMPNLRSIIQTYIA